MYTLTEAAAAHTEEVEEVVTAVVEVEMAAADVAAAVEAEEVVAEWVLWA